MALASPPADRRAARHAGTRAEIVAAAWSAVREEGLAGLSMRDLGARVGMRAQSVYSYVASKDEIYDEMFRQGWTELLEAMAGVRVEMTRGGSAPDPVAGLRLLAHRFFDFCTADPVRYQLMFQRTLPGFVPSAESYAVAVDALTRLGEDLATVGVVGPEAVDLTTAVFTGLTSQQISNDPGGDRWERLVDRAVSMLLTELAPELDHRPRTTTGGDRT